MKLLLDENIPHALRTVLPGHEVVTVAYLEWQGIENGELLAKAADQGFEVVISLDKGLASQHDQSRLPIAIVLLHGKGNTAEDILVLAPAILEALRTLQPRALIRVPNLD